MNEGEPTTEQLQAVINYARRWGKHWKERLIDEWMDGYGYGTQDSHLLQQVRNQFGPQWLAKLPETVRHV